MREARARLRGGQRDAHAALIVGEARAADEADLLHSRQHPGKAGTRQAAQFPDLARLERSRIEQHPHDPPLLLGDPMSVENGPEAADDVFPGLQHEQRQVAVLQSDCFRMHSVCLAGGLVKPSLTRPGINGTITNILVRFFGER